MTIQITGTVYSNENKKSIDTYAISPEFNISIEFRRKRLVPTQDATRVQNRQLYIPCGQKEKNNVTLKCKTRNFYK